MMEGVAAPEGACKNPRPPPGPGDAGVNGAEVSAPPGSEKPTGLFSLIRDARGAGALVGVVGEELRLRRQQKRMPRWDILFCCTRSGRGSNPRPQP